MPEKLSLNKSVLKKYEVNNVDEFVRTRDVMIMLVPKDFVFFLYLKDNEVFLYIFS